MIKDIKISNVATFDEKGQAIKSLKGINFIYGENGTGKSTITRVINDVDSFSNCSIEYEDTDFELLVYNKDFVENNFKTVADLDGIFTLGKATKEILESIEQLNVDVEEYRKQYKNLDETKKAKTELLNKSREELDEQCWKIKKNFEQEFFEAFKGKNTKVKFADMVLSTAPEEFLIDLQPLKEQYKDIHNSDGSYIDKLLKIKSDVYDEEQIALALDEIIVGKENSIIATVIEKLGNSDWVRSGIDFIDEENICPFCQQELPIDFDILVSDYFDKTYLNSIKSLESKLTRWTEYYNNVLELVEGLNLLKCKYLDDSRLAITYTELKSKIDKNLILFSEKLEKPSKSFQMISILDSFNQINDLVNEANEKIEIYNNKIKNIKTEKDKINLKVWSFIRSQCESSVKSYLDVKNSTDKALNGIGIKLNEIKVSANKKKSEIAKYENDIKSIKPTINAINNLLNKFGYKGFRIEETEQKGRYKVVRMDGSNAKSTLSEGETTFVSFLYFYYSIFGSTNEELINKRKVVVMDDPISSLDSCILFIVSSLIRAILGDIRENKGNVIQLILFTHNVYFHKEVTYSSKGTAAKTKFWTINKENNVSVIIEHQCNPIISSYEYMWKIFNNYTGVDSIYIQNIMRRILENYFRVMGGNQEDYILSHFEGEERVLCRSLLSWTHDGSHFLHDDLYLVATNTAVEAYKNVFKDIFSRSGHHAHYEMMTKIL